MLKGAPRSEVNTKGDQLGLLSEKDVVAVAHGPWRAHALQSSELTAVLP